MVPEDRRNQGFIPLLSIERNIAVPNYDFLSKASNVNRAEEKKLGIDAVGKLDIRPADSQLPVGNLSGGNQQKVVISKYIDRNIRVLILDEPTRGIDVGAKDQIYEIIEGLAQQGMAVIVISSEIPELQLMCDRICVVSQGKVTTVIDRSEFADSDNILRNAIGI